MLQALHVHVCTVLDCIFYVGNVRGIVSEALYLCEAGACGKFV